MTNEEVFESKIMSWRHPSRRGRGNNSGRDDWDITNPFDLDFDFSLGFEGIDELIESMFKTAKAMGRETPVSGPVYYGYSVTVGPDGKPNIREFGNVKPTRRGTLEVGSREPFVDTVVDDKDGKLKVIAEMPGVQREDIHLEALEDSLTIRAEHGDRKYETTVPLNQGVEPSSASATYNNGVLEVSFKIKGGAGKPRGVNIKVD